MIQLGKEKILSRAVPKFSSVEIKKVTLDSATFPLRLYCIIAFAVALVEIEHINGDEIGLFVCRFDRAPALAFDSLTPPRRLDVVLSLNSEGLIFVKGSDIGDISHWAYERAQ